MSIGKLYDEYQKPTETHSSSSAPYIECNFTGDLYVPVDSAESTVNYEKLVNIPFDYKKQDINMKI